MSLIRGPDDVLGTALSFQHVVRALQDSDSPSVVCIGGVSLLSDIRRREMSVEGSKEKSVTVEIFFGPSRGFAKRL